MKPKHLGQLQEQKKILDSSTQVVPVWDPSRDLFCWSTFSDVFVGMALQCLLVLFFVGLPK